ncbi:MAG TPA: class I SAM-dependent methyltransferase [Catalimonadaceae bacterium]|nr:class I SAM-dependent methyltransferase [Catalimonadaceae bacterium]HPI10000.1 class I SAM-dependent methyltransferase [Catalimonadaceae bacterium]
MIKNNIRKWKQMLIQDLFGSIYRPGHFYSTIPNADDYEKNLPLLLNKQSAEIPGVNLNFAGQAEFLENALPFYSEAPFPELQTAGINYYYKNIYFVSPDAISLYLILRTFKPKRVIEVGCGFSSAVIIDTNQRFMNNEIECTFIDPFPDRLQWFLKESTAKSTIIEKKVQDVDWEDFSKLDAGDLLLIDSSHVSKLGSDVNYLFFNIIPRLKKGVVVHVHDVMYPFEYPIAWVNEKRFWNEAYLLHSFLTNNESFKLVLFNSFMTIHHNVWLKKNMPRLGNAEGGSIYMVKTN